MNWPTSQDYNEAVQNAGTNIADPDLKKGEATVNAIGLPVPRSGNFADVYQFKGADGTMWAVKCFTRRVEGLQERYLNINQYLQKARLPFTVGFNYLEEGIRVRGQWFPLLKMEWVEGFTLNEFVKQNADKPSYLHGLMQMWAKLTAKLRDANIAHADLQHGNVLLVPGNTPSKLGLKLIDYDGMWVPPLADHHSGEVGHPNFQHPSRLKDRLFNADVDRFPHLVIAAALRATLVGGKRFWEKFDNGDNLLFRENDLRQPEKAPIFKSLWELNDKVLRTLVGHIALASKAPLRKTPWLDDLLLDEETQQLSRSQEDQVVAMLGVSKPTAVAAEQSSIVEVQYGEFDVVDDTDDEQENEPLPMRVEDDEERERRARRRSKKKGRGKKQRKASKMPLMIGGGVAAVVMLGTVLAFALGGKKDDSEKQEPSQIASNDETPERPKPKLTPVPKDPVPSKTPKSDIPREIKLEVPPTAKGEDLPEFVPGAIRLSKAAVAIAAVPRSQAYLYICDKDPTLHMVEEGKNVPLQIGQDSNPLTALAVSSDGVTAVTGSSDGMLRTWPIPIRKAIVSYPKLNSFRGNYSYSSFHDSIFIHDNASGKDAVVNVGVPGHPILAGFKNNYDGKNLKPALGEALTDEVSILNDALRVQVFQGGAMVYEKTSKIIWWGTHIRRKTSTNSQSATQAHAGAIVACAVSKDGKRVVSIGKDDWLSCRDIEDGRQVAKIKTTGATAIAFLSNSNKVLIGTATGSASIWDLEPKGKKVGKPQELSGHAAAVRAVCISPDGKSAATGGEDGSILVWSLPAGTLRRRIDVGAHITAVTFARSNHFLASMHPGGIKFWDPEGGQVLHEVSGGHFSCFSFFDDERVAVIGAADDNRGNFVAGLATGLPHFKPPVKK